MLDSKSTTETLHDFAAFAEGAWMSCNADKLLLFDYLVPTAKPACPWYRFGKCDP